MRRVSIASFFLGVVVTVILSSLCIPAVAAYVTKTIDVATGVKCYYNDREIVLRDAAGNAVEPFIYNGTTYLPARALSNVFKQAITYDANTKGVYIGTHDSTTPTIMLHQLKPYDNGATSPYGDLLDYTTLKDNKGNIYGNGFTYSDALGTYDTDYRSAHRSYMIDGMYTKMQGYFFITNAASDTKRSGILRIYGDEKPLYTSPELKAGMDPIRFDVNISGVKSVKIQITSTEGSKSFAVADIGLYQ